MNFFKRIFSRKKKGTADEIVKLAVIQDFSLPERASHTEPLTVLVQGYFSHLGWQLAEASAVVKKDEIILQVLGKMKAGMMAAQAIKPFDLKIEVKNLKPGTYKVRAKRGTTKELEVVID